MIYLKKAKKVKIPIISALDGFHDIVELKLGDVQVSEITRRVRET